MSHWTTGYSHAFGLKLVAPPAAEPVALADLKNRLRITTADEDSDLSILIAQARELCEAYCQRAFITQTYSLLLDDFPRHHVWKWQAIRIPRPPLQTVTYLRYYDTYGNLQTYDPANYTVTTAGEPARIVPLWGSFWNFVQWGRPEAVELRYVAGYGDTGAAVPAAAKAAIMVTCAAMRQNPALTEIPGAARAFLNTLDPGEVR